MEAHHAVLESGEKLACDMLVVASGCKYNLQPNFLQEMNLSKENGILHIELMLIIRDLSDIYVFLFMHSDLH